MGWPHCSLNCCLAGEPRAAIFCALLFLGFSLSEMVETFPNSSGPGKRRRDLLGFSKLHVFIGFDVHFEQILLFIPIVLSNSPPPVY